MGKAAQYVSNYLIRLDAGKKLTEDKEFGIKGYHVKVGLVKSRSAAAGIDIEAIYNQADGYSDVLSSYNFLKKEGEVGGAGRSFYIKGLDDVKFSQKLMTTKYNEVPELKEFFDQKVHSILRDNIPRPGFVSALEGRLFEDNEVQVADFKTEDGEDIFIVDGDYYIKNESDRYIKIDVEESAEW